MTYEELRQRCLNFAEMHPSNPGNLVFIARYGRIRAVAKGNMDRFEELATELANFIENRENPRND